MLKKHYINYFWTVVHLLWGDKTTHFMAVSKRIWNKEIVKGFPWLENKDNEDLNAKNHCRFILRKKVNTYLWPFYTIHLWKVNYIERHNYSSIYCTVINLLLSQLIISICTVRERRYNQDFPQANGLHPDILKARMSTDV